jgi:hypothetical protein
VAAQTAPASVLLAQAKIRVKQRVPDTYQLIVLDNVDVPAWLAAQPRCVHFTGQPTVGRAGFFPPLS